MNIESIKMEVLNYIILKNNLNNKASIDGYQNNSFCLMKKESGYEVCFYRNQKKYQTRDFNDFDLAATFLLGIISNCEVSLLNEYNRLINLDEQEYVNEVEIPYMMLALEKRNKRKKLKEKLTEELYGLKNIINSKIGVR